MGLNSSQVAKPKSSSKTLLVIAILLIVICIPIGLAVNFLLNFNQMSAHEQSFFRAVGTDLRQGDLKLTTAKATAQRNLQESKAKIKQSNERVDEAERKYQEALAEQKELVASKAKKSTIEAAIKP